jgi:hypothetical protein
MTELRFSGRPNPRWIIVEAGVLQELAGRLKDLAPTDKPDWPILGPRGFLLYTEDQFLLADYDLYPMLRVFQGVIEIGDKYFSDMHGLEQWIAQNWPR